VSPVRLVGGRYRVDEVIGTGAMGTVWRGYDTRLRRRVAIKEVHLAAAVTDEQRKVLTRRAMAEARHAARVSHPNIVAVHDVVADRGLPCLVMRLVEGRSLSDLVRKEGPATPARTAEIGIALVDALSAAHRAGVVHRDVKPSNVLLTETEVLLTDFSIATDSEHNTMSAGSGALGSPGYIAPERLKGEPTGAEADLFGLGATLFCAVEGRGPFDRADPLASLLATATSPHPMPKRAGPMGALLDALLAKDPSERPDLAEIRAALVAVARAPEATEPGPVTGPVPDAETSLLEAVSPAAPPVSPASVPPDSDRPERPVPAHVAP
jgi:serine/threonine protein kinase